MDCQYQDAGIRFVLYIMTWIFIFKSDILFQNSALNFALLLFCSDDKPGGLESVHIDIYIWN